MLEGGLWERERERERKGEGGGGNGASLCPVSRLACTSSRGGEKGHISRGGVKRTRGWAGAGSGCVPARREGGCTAP